jgi:DNA-binding MarR family transcriptional regulator
MLSYAVGRLHDVLNKRLRDGLAPLGITVPQYTALSVFRVLGALSNAQLAERTMVSPQAANDMVKAMEAKGWIARRPDPDHGRIIRISLSDEGLAICVTLAGPRYPPPPSRSRSPLPAPPAGAARIAAQVG